MFSPLGSLTDFIINLSYDGGFTDLSFGGGGGLKVPPPIFICENHRKSNKIMHCIEFFLSGSFEDKVIFHVVQLSYDGGGPYVPITDR